MKRLLAAFILLPVVLCGRLSAQNGDLLQVYQRNFVRGNLTTKIQLLQDAASQKAVDMSPLYAQALRFVTDNAAIFRNDLLARELAVLTIRLVALTGHSAGVPMLWELFMQDESRAVRVEILHALATLKPKDAELIRNLNRWLAGENQALRAGRVVDPVVVGEAAVALGKIGDESSFPVLFTAGMAGYSDQVSKWAREALYSIGGDFAAAMRTVLRENRAVEKLEAFRIAMEYAGLRDADRGAIAETALRQGLAARAVDAADREYLRQLRYEAVRTLTALKWSRATSDVIAHFDRVLQELQLGIGRTPQVLEAVACLGAMSTHEAAVRLAQYLDTLNSDVENGRQVDDQIVLAVIANLASLGDKVAFDYLLYAVYLDYSDRVKRAAREALNRL